MQEFEAEIRVNPAAIPARLNLATLLAQSRPGEAERLLKEAAKQSPDDPLVEYNLGAFYLLHSRPADAIPHLERALQLKPVPPRAADELARAKRMLETTR
jgi:predicted Zn-dependent protease